MKASLRIAMPRLAAPRLAAPRLAAMSVHAMAGLAALFLIACGGSGPDPREPAPALPMTGQANPNSSEPGEKGEGNISFHYSNKSTDANLAIDLGTTDLYLEMTGEPAKATVEQAKAAQREQEEPHPIARRKIAKPEPQEDQDEPAPEPEAPKNKARASQPQHPEAQAPHAQPKPEEPPPAEDPGSYEDVTSKVLTGIRKAQEFFYQKRYPEALQAVRSSLDARPTAEGYALAGSIEYMMGQSGMARRQWLEALRLNPDMPAVVNMLEKTRTPGGRGSPNPRPIAPRPAPRPAVLPEGDQAPFPEEYNGGLSPDNSAPAQEAAPPSGSAPMQRSDHLARPTMPRPSAQPVPEPALIPAATPAAVAPAAAPAEEEDAAPGEAADEPATAPKAAPSSTSAPSTQVPAAPAVPSKAGAPKSSPAKDPKAAQPAASKAAKTAKDKKAP